MKWINKCLICLSLVCILCTSCEQRQVNSISASDVHTILQSDHQYTVLDVRTPEEFKEGTLPGAVNIDVKSDEFEKQIEQLDKEDHYILHCRSGKRSMMAYAKMQDAGFKHLKNMDGGYLEYAELFSDK